MQLLTSEMDTSHEERPDDAGTACLLVERGEDGDVVCVLHDKLMESKLRHMLNRRKPTLRDQRWQLP